MGHLGVQNPNGVIVGRDFYTLKRTTVENNITSNLDLNKPNHTEQFAINYIATKKF